MGQLISGSSKLKVLWDYTVPKHLNGDPDYYRLGESLRSDVLGGAEIALKRFVPELKKKVKKTE